MRASSRFVLAYICPHCGAALEAADDGWDGWRRCAACGQPGLPPKADSLLRRKYALELERGATDEPEPGIDAALVSQNGPNPESILQTQPEPSPIIGTARLIFKTGFVLSLALVLISYLDQKSTTTVIFATLAVIFFLLLLRFPAKPRRREGTQS